GLIPPNRIPQPLVALPGEPGRRLRERLLNAFLGFALEPRKPRDLALRGQLDEAEKQLTELQMNLGRMRDRIATAPTAEEDARQWCEQMTNTYAALIVASKPGGDPGAAAEAQAKVDQLWEHAQPMYILIERAIGDPLAAESTFQLALINTEQADQLSRQQATDDEVREAWKNAAPWWTTYLANYSGQAWISAEQIAHARTLQAAARRAAEKPK